MAVDFLLNYYVPFALGISTTVVVIGSCASCFLYDKTGGDVEKVAAIFSQIKKLNQNSEPNQPRFKIKLPGSINLTDLARQGKIAGAYQRESKIQELIDAVNQGSVIICGPPGAGKTALVEELACRIVKNKIPSLKEIEIFRLNLRGITGNAGVQNLISNFWSGGVENRVKELIEQIQREHGKGNECLLFIDEIQDLLKGEVGIFDQFKEELARKGFRLVGATTDLDIIEQLRNRSGTGAGMARRIQVIELAEMTKSETISVIQDLTKKPLTNKYSGVKFVYAKDFSQAVVELAKERYRDKIFPDCAVCLFEDLHRYYFDHNPYAGAEIHLGLKEVAHYLARVKVLQENVLIEKVQRSISTTLFHARFSQLFFTGAPELSTNLLLVSEEADRLTTFFESHQDAPFLFLKGDSEIFLSELAALHAKKNCQETEPLFLCDVSYLAKNANHSDGVAALKSALQKLFLGKDKKPILVLNQFNPHWFPRPTPQQAPNPTSPQLEKILNQATSALGVPSISEMRNPQIPVQKVPAILTTLMEFIEKEQLPTIITNTEDLNFEREKWSSLTVRPLAINDMITWLDWRYRSEYSNNEICTTLYSFHYLAVPSLPLSIIDMTVLAFDRHAKGAVLPKAMLQVLRGARSLEEIKKARTNSSWLMENPPFIQIPPSKARPPSKEQLRIPENHLHSSTLVINESSLARREWITYGIANLFASTMKSFTVIPTRLNQLPESLKKVLIENMVGQESLIFTSEELKDQDLLRLIEKGNNKVVIFRAATETISEHPTSPTPALIPSLIAPLVEEGRGAIRTAISDLLPTSPGKTSPAAAPLGHTPSPLSEEESREIFNFFFPIPEMDTVKKQQIIDLYLFLCNKGVSFDDALRYLQNDFKSQKNSENIVEQFAGLYEKKHQFCMEEALYAINPALTSPTYRIKRAVNDTFKTGWYYLTLPPRFILSNKIVSVLSLASGWMVSRVIPWLRHWILRT